MRMSWPYTRLRFHRPCWACVMIRALYGTHEDLEGPSTEGIVILEFPTREAAKAWYESSSYREVREHRFKGATYRVTLVEGV